MKTEHVKETWKYNIYLAESILEKSDGINKGAYVHDINGGRHRLRSWLTLVKKQAIPVTAEGLKNEDFVKMCKARKDLASDLYMAANF